MNGEIYKDLLEYLEDELNQVDHIFMRTSKSYGSKEWKFLMILDHFRTFLDETSYRLACRLALEAYSSIDIKLKDELSQLLFRMDQKIFEMDFLSN